MSVVLETQKAVYALLSGDTTLAGLVSGVFDYVAADVAYPYVTVGDITAEDNSVQGLKRWLLNMNVNVYGRALGRSEALGIIERLRVLLDDQPLSITGFTHVFTKVVSFDTKQDSDGSAVNGRLVLKIYVEAVE